MLSRPLAKHTKVRLELVCFLFGHWGLDFLRVLPGHNLDLQVWSGESREGDVGFDLDLGLWTLHDASRASKAAPMVAASSPSEAAMIVVASKQGWNARRFAS